MFKVPEKYRVKSNEWYGSDESYGNNGAFTIPLSNRSVACIIASDGEGWEHISVHIVTDGKDRTPTWPEMCKIKDIFWGEEDCVVQYHPPKSDYVNNHQFTLHLWRPVNVELPRPDSIMVGIK